MKLNKTNVILWALVFVSALIFLFSIIFSGTRTSRKGTKTALLNNKYDSLISEISIKEKGNDLNLLKIKDIWFVEVENTRIPADSVKIEKFLRELKSLRTIYKISENNKKLNQFGLDSQNLCELSYKVENNITKLYFGNHDFSQNFRYFKTEKNLNIYEIDTRLDLYLNPSVQSWTEPYLVSKTICPAFSSENIMKVTINSPTKNKIYSDNKSEYILKLTELRHGGFVNKADLEKTATIKIELGNKESVLLEIFSTDDVSEFNCYVSYYDSQSKLTFKVPQKISSWTYEKLLELK